LRTSLPKCGETQKGFAFETCAMGELIFLKTPKGMAKAYVESN
jgi:hypothetical protein